MTNQPIFLTFKGTDEALIPPLRPQIVADICNGLEAAYREAGKILADDDGYQLTLFLLGSPTIGSSRFKLEARFKTPDEPKPGMLKSVFDAGSTAGGWAGVAALLWLVLFGENGMLDMSRRGSDAPPESSFDVAAREPIHRPEMKPVIAKILDAAAKSGASRVELESDAGIIVVLYDQGRRTSAGLLAREGLRLDPLFSGAVQGSLQRSSAEILRGYWEAPNQPVTVFTALAERASTHDPARRSVVVIWLSKRAPPADGEAVEFRGQVITEERLASLKLTDDVPIAFEKPELIILVTQATVWG